MKTQHTNIASGYRYHGGNALILEQAAKAAGFTAPEWCTKAQAEKLGRQVVPGAAGVVVLLNEQRFTVYNVAQLASAAPAPQQAAVAPVASKATPAPKPAGAQAATLAAFRQAMPKQALSIYPREARAFFDGLPNGGTYTAYMGMPRGELIHGAFHFLAEHGDAHGRRYSLQVEQTGWAIYTNTNSKGKLLKQPELRFTVGLDFQGLPAGCAAMQQPEVLETLRLEGLVQPCYRMQLTPAAAQAAA